MKALILSFLIFLTLPALATQPDTSFMGRFGFEIMIFSGFFLMVVLGLLPVWIEKRNHRMLH